ncbi:MAG TPA: DUF2157 domain-containing protein [Candidatus Angelobacter sp.]|nr:DUF2157 domain-containing protein [Candidatus Angelobacter sp.]
MSWDKDLQRWVEAHLIDAVTAERIREFERESQKGWRWPAILAVGFGVLMLCAGILLFVAAHWDELSPAQRSLLVLGMTAVFHVAAGLLGDKVPAIGTALHVAGTATLGAGIFLAGQIFNLEEHWPGGIMLWALGAVLAWLVLRQWPQALLAAVLIPSWLGSEWSVATERYSGAWHIAAQGFLLLAILYFSVPQKESNRALRLGLMWVGCFMLIPFLGDVMYSGESYSLRYSHAVPARLTALGYAAAYLPAVVLAATVRKQQAAWIFGSATWVLVLGFLSQNQTAEHNPWIYLWVALGACLLCWWGVRDGRRLFINYGTAVFALNVLAFYFSEVLDKMGRSMGLILLGVIFLAGGWVLNRLRSDLIARAAAGEKR